MGTSLPTPPGSPDSDRAALVALYIATDGPNWTRNTNWLSDAPIGEWHGVTTAYGRVTDLGLFDNGLVGSIPAELGDLDRLERLELSYNNVTGLIPAELGSLHNLQGLGLASNSLTGLIPVELGNLHNLVGLSLARNSLTGSIPAELGRLDNLRTLDLTSNNLTGPIPHSLTTLTALEEFHFGRTGLCAPRDSTLQEWLQDINDVRGYSCTLEPLDMAALVALYDATNGLSWKHNKGWLSDRPAGDWYGITADASGRVTRLNLSDNNLTGSIPAELGNLDNLTWLDLSDNNLTGLIPTELGDLDYIEALGLEGNS